MEPRASRDGLACDRALAALEVGKSRGQEQPARSRPAACFACRMALRKGEAPCVPKPAGDSSALGRPELLGARGGNGAAGVLEGTAAPDPRGSPFPIPA